MWRVIATQPIGVFDSGVGGLSVLREIRRLLPGEDLLYIADSGHAPYGERDEDFIEQRSTAIVDFLLAQGAKAVVVACNTATGVAVDELRARYSLPIVAIEPALKPAAQATTSGVISVLATARTLESEKFARLRERHASGVKVLEQACPGWVELVERGELDSDEARTQVMRHVQPSLDEGADVLVLGCTHFPFLRPLIEAVAGPLAKVIDPAEAVARELRRRLGEAGLLNAVSVGGEVFHSSGELRAAERVIEALWGRRVEVREL
jgi:glutamate racemase